MSRFQQPRNRLLAEARLRLPSPSGAPRPMSRQELAEAVNAYIWRQHQRHEHLDHTDIGKLERGVVRWPGKQRREALRAVLGAASNAHIGLYPRRGGSGDVYRIRRADLGEVGSVGFDEADVQAGSPLLARLESRRQSLHDAVFPGRTGNVSVEEWQQIVAEHGRATRSRPAVELLIDLGADCDGIRRGLTASRVPAAVRDLTVCAAQLAGLIFLTLIKLNDAAGARAWARTANLVAAQSDDPQVKAWVRAHEAYVYYYCGDLPGALEVARHARELSKGRGGVAEPLAAALEARAYAGMGRKREALRAAGQAEDATAQLDGADSTPSAFGYNEAQLRFHQGNAFTTIGETEAALAAQQRALALYPAEDYLDRTLVMLDSSACRLRGGDTTGAMSEALTTLTALPSQQRDGLLTARGRDLLAAVPVRDRQIPLVPPTRRWCGPSRSDR